MKFISIKHPYYLLFIALCSVSIALVAAYYKPSYPNSSNMYNLLGHTANISSKITAGAVVLFLIMSMISKWKTNEKNES